LRGRYGEPFLKSIDRALAAKPEGRYQDAREWREAVEGRQNEDVSVAVSEGGSPEVPEGSWSVLFLWLTGLFFLWLITLAVLLSGD